MSARHVLPVVVVFTILPAASAPASVTAWTEVAVRVYDTTGRSDAERKASLDVAASIVSAASVDVSWRVCEHKIKRQRAKGKGCDSPMRPGELALRIVRSPVPRDYRGELPLGDALIDTRAGAGVLATVYLDRVEWMARQSGADPRALLGRAVAHELGHLLMANNSHGAGGLMRPVWSRKELQRSRMTDWVFAPVEIAAIKARTLAR